jgi:NAD+ diphosphatase
MVNLEGQRAKQCPQCKLVNYPRLSPSIIVAVRRGNELLLARSPRFPAGMYSVLAGFVEPGETLEQAVEREVQEEVGLTVKNICYFGSQPWPFPNSLMIGYRAEYAGGEIQIDRVEIEDAGWYTAEHLPAIPSRISIARQLIEAFIRTTQ